MTFCWPCADKVLNYLEDRHDAKQSAMNLVTAGIRLLSERQRPGCTINIHVLGHSTGAYVIREAFADADDCSLAKNAWTVSQVVFVAGDVSSDSMRQGDRGASSLYRHCYRLTNYFSRHDHVLKLSNAKRLGIAPRVGRVGLPQDAPEKAVDLDCSDYFHRLNTDPHLKAQDQAASFGAFEHSWYIGNKAFARDLFETLKGDLDRAVIPTRKSVLGSRRLVLAG